MNEPTTECPVCFGEGHHDHRDDDARWSESCSDETLAELRARGFVHPVGIVRCSECEGTGIVTVERAREIRAVSLAYIDQIVAKVAAEDAEKRGRR